MNNQKLRVATPSLNPLCVDLDGTLIATDSLWESVLLLLRYHFWYFWLLPLWLMKGRAYLKHQIAQHVTLEVATLPYRDNVLAFLEAEKKQGRKLVLATAAHHKIATAVASFLNLFDEVIASDANTNMKGTCKRDALNNKFGVYDYIGDSSADLPIWQAANKAYVVTSNNTLLKQVQCPPDRVFSSPKITWRVWLKALRPHQWSKNLLIFLPLILSQQLGDTGKVVDALLAFIAFSLVASAGYILNDLLDLAADRVHHSKKNRPFAAGLLPIQYGLALFVVLICLSFFLAAWWLSWFFTGMVGLYLLLTMAYSFFLKRKRVIDVFVLASLYTHRILAGGIAVSVPISSWLLAFSMFLFISLAFIKRYVELLQLTNSKVIKHRDYEVTDMEMIASMGPTSAYIAVLVFALYINSDKVSILYSSPFFLWLICPVLLYWITRVWFLARRGEMLEDPVKFVLTDKLSWLVSVCIIVIVLLAVFLDIQDRLSFIY